MAFLWNAVEAVASPVVGVITNLVGSGAITHEVRDRTDPTARAQGQQRAREENERKIKELRDEMERNRQEALRDAQQRARIEDEEQREQLNRQRREREEKERKQKEEERFYQHKGEMMNYDFQTRPRIKKESFRDLQVDEIDMLRVALIGPAGSGKTSFVGTLQRAIGEPQSAFEQGAGGEGTIHLEEYYVQKNIRMVDTRGFFDRDERLVEECLKIMSGRIRAGEEIVRNYDQRDASQKLDAVSKRVPGLSKYAHAVVFVVKANDPRLTDGKYKDTLQKIREHFREDGYTPVTVITYLDKLKDEEEKDEAFEQASWATGSARDRTYFISNYLHVDSEQSIEVDRTALDILDSVLISAESFIRVHKQREKNQMEREAMAREIPSGAETLDQFFSRLQKKYKWTNQGKIKAVLETLRQQEINTTEVLKELWEDVKSKLPLSIGMKIGLEEEMKCLQIGTNQ